MSLLSFRSHLRTGAFVAVALVGLFLPVSWRGIPHISWLALLWLFGACSAYIPVSSWAARFAEQKPLRTPRVVNSMSRDDSLSVLQFAALLLMIQGLALSIRSIAINTSPQPWRLAPLAMGVGMLLGLWITKVVLHRAVFDQQP
jgi:hypothetical protein